jgi:hypothetical protein
MISISTVLEVSSTAVFQPSLDLIRMTLKVPELWTASIDSSTRQQISENEIEDKELEKKQLILTLKVLASKELISEVVIELNWILETR